ncbi:hypothetical protein SAMN05216388_1002322 [Halorientalis persicus]|uniref:Uncharacterized protein n=1 Tax=Halorientalis persicus TaxID=1367881 RepID=A0A1H8FM64_9EURY|nr:hypothetical protein [Halorientalis persicus]SEN32680.1 hypothetical protein SAMN05216388_1002322 [Halorientalis persicus]
MTRRDHTVSIAEDDRARIPFALIGVIVLISSVAVVGTLQTRPEPQPDTDPSLAMDRAVSTSQTAIKDAVRTAMKDAAAEPLTTTASTPVGNAIDDSGGDTFDDYVKLRVYLETAEALRTSGQRVDTEMRTDLSLPPVEYTEGSIEDAIDRVDLTVGHESGSLDAGKVTAEISGIDVTVRDNGSQVASDTRTVSVTVSSTAFALDEKVTEYENRLNRGFFEANSLMDGFGRKFAARLYPMAYAKAYYERVFGDVPPGTEDIFERINKNKHSEVLANDAIFGIQKQTFDATDPYAARTMKGEWACMGAKVVQDLSSGRASDKISSNVSGISGPLSASTFCSGAKALFGDANGNLPKIPTPGDFVDRRINALFGPSTGVSSEHDIAIDRFAEAAYEDMTGGGMSGDNWLAKPDIIDEVQGKDKMPDIEEELPEDMGDGRIETAIDRTYEVKSWAETTDESSSISIPSVSSPDDDDLSGCSADSTDYSIDSVDSVSASRNDVWNSDADGSRKPVVRFDVDADVTVETSVDFSCSSHDEKNDSNAPFSGSGSDTSSGSVSFDVEIDGKHSTGTGVLRNGVDSDYGSDSNFKAALDKAVSAHIADDGEGSIEGDVNGASGTDLGSSTSASEVEDEVVDAVSLDGSQKTHDLSAPGGLEGSIESDIEDFRGVVKSEVSNASFSRLGMATGKGPFEELKNNVDQRALVHHDRTPTNDYSSARRKAKIEARRIYIQRLYHWIDEINSTRNEARDKADNKITDALGGAMDGLSGGIDVLNKGLGFAQEAMSGDTSLSMANRGTVAETPLTEDITYSVHGSPTYLTKSPLTRATVPAIRPEYANVTEPMDTMHASMAVRNRDLIAYPGLPIIPWPTFWYLSVDAWQVNVQGEYARFAVSANRGDPSTTGGTTYVRQAQPVTIGIAGRGRRAGTVDPITFDSDTLVIIPVPGGTVMPGKGNMGVGDRVDVPGRPSLVRKKCSKTWDYTGPGFRPNRAAGPDKCDDGGNTGSTSLSTDLVPGGGDVAWDGDGLEFEASGFEYSTDEGLEYEGEEAGCDASDLYEELESQPDNPYSSAEDITDEIWESYCRLYKPTYKSQFAEFLGSSDDSVQDSWRTVVPEVDENSLRRTMYYLLDDGDGDFDGTGSVVDRFDIVRFTTAEEANEPHIDDGERPPHKRGGIVTEVETDDTEALARVYDGPWMPGKFFGRPGDLEGKDWQQIVGDLALIDNRTVKSGSKDEMGWGVYDCIGKTFVPKGGYDLSIDYTSGFYLEELKRDLPGSTIQFEISHHDGSSEENIDPDHWVPLGTIGYFRQNPDKLEDRWDDVDGPDDHVVGTDNVCRSTP